MMAISSWKTLTLPLRGHPPPWRGAEEGLLVLLAEMTMGLGLVDQADGQSDDMDLILLPNQYH